MLVSNKDTLRRQWEEIMEHALLDHGGQLPGKTIIFAMTIRRGFYEAREQSPKVSGWFLRQIQNLYRIESVLRDQKAGPALRAAVRGHQSRPIVERIGRALVRFKTIGRFLPKSLMGEAIDYARDQWSALRVYLGDGRVEIDNNLVGNAIRPRALGKKNWLFVGEADAGQRGAIVYTIIECCRRHGIDLYTYLRDVLTRLPHMTNRQVPEVTPEAWHKAVETEVRRYIGGLDEATKRKIWESSEDAAIIPNADIDTITDCLYPHIFQATLPRIHRAVRNRERKEGEPMD